VKAAGGGIEMILLRKYILDDDFLNGEMFFFFENIEGALNLSNPKKDSDLK